MALATRPKPRVQHKKRRGVHHRHNKPYLKTYAPYLPMLAVVGVGVVVNNNWPESLVKLDPALSSSLEPVTRVEALAGTQDTWALALIIIMAGVAFAIFVFQHWFRVQRLINRGERFIVKHPLFDLALVVVFTAGFILTRSVI